MCGGGGGGRERMRKIDLSGFGQERAKGKESGMGKRDRESKREKEREGEREREGGTIMSLYEKDCKRRRYYLSTYPTN